MSTKAIAWLISSLAIGIPVLFIAGILIISNAVPLSDSYGFSKESCAELRGYKVYWENYKKFLNETGGPIEQKYKNGSDWFDKKKCIFA